MRLIDGDALIARWKAAMLHMEKVESGMHPVGMEAVIDDVAHRPTIEAELVRHGRWVMTIYTTTSERGRVISNAKFACSECGYGNGRKQTNYCPNCGIKMDKENDNGKL